MQTYARVVVVGGGCVGVSVLYALAKRGWTDCALLERTSLTAGSTWHAAGLIPSYARSNNVGRMIAKTIEIYEGLEAETGQNVGWHKCGQLRIANTRDRMDEYKSYMDVAEAQGTNARLVSPKEAMELWPLLENNKHMIGALYHPDDGHIAPADVTMAMAKGARDMGQKIYQNTQVNSFERLPNGEWKVSTNNGDIICEHIVSATGNYARQTGALLGIDIPAIPILHQYWITDAVPEIIERKKQGLPEMPILRDEGFAGYLREEGDGLMFGPYERTEHLKLFAVDGVPEWFGADLVEEDFDAVEWNWEVATDYVPALARTGIKANVRGPFQMTADELPLAGPAWDLPNVWLAEGVPGGILWGGTLGFHLAEWIIDGAPSKDMSELDPRRFSNYANKTWTRHKVQETWGTHADIKFPGQTMPASRPQKTAPSYDRLTEMGAVWDVLNGWEMPQWFAPSKEEAIPDLSFRHTQRAAKYIREEVTAVREGVGLIEMTPMTKFEVSGPGAESWLDGILANKLPKLGRIGLCHHLNKNGGVVSEYTVIRFKPDAFYLISTPRGERLNFDELSKILPDDRSVTLTNVTMERGAFTLVGPKARDVLQKITEVDLSNAAFPWMSMQTGTIGLASDVRMLRVTYEGELGWELYHPIGYQRHLLDEILKAGEEFGIRMVGLAALECCRLDKSYRAMYRDMNAELTALESSLDRFIKFDKGDFIGRDALIRQREEGLKRRICTITIATDGASVQMNEGVYHNGKLVGRITSGGYSCHFSHDIALALLPLELGNQIGLELEVQVLGEWRKAKVVEESLYDPTNARCKM